MTRNDPPQPRHRQVRANGIDFTVLEIGDGPLALCLHGFPDTADSWRAVLARLAAAGYRAVAPFMRGYAPTGLAPDGDYRLAALVADVNALHESLDGDGRAVLIGNDWGAEAAYGAAALCPERWRHLVTLAIPPRQLDERLFSDYDQLRRFFYIPFLQTAAAEEIVAAQDMRFLDRLWADWSPGFAAGAEITAMKHSLRAPENLSAAIAYYRAPAPEDVAADDPMVAESRALLATPPQPTLYLHGERDGCIGVEFCAQALPYLAPGSAAEVVPGVGHFLHAERPAEISERILQFVSGRGAARS